MTIEELKDNVVSLKQELNEKFTGAKECLQQELSELSISTIERLQKELNDKLVDTIKYLQEVSKTIYEPAFEETYYAVDTQGDVFVNSNIESVYDIKRIAFGNYYKTYEEAEFEAECQKYTNLYRKYIKEHDKEKIDWNNANQYKYTMGYDVSSQGVFCSGSSKFNQDSMRASNKQVLQDAVEFIGKDNFVKYVLRIDK